MKILSWFIKTTGLYRLINWFMDWWGFRIELNKSYTLLAGRLEWWMLAREMVSGATYPMDWYEGVGTLIDLGCNAGFFTVITASVNDNRMIKALLVDADYRCVRNARKTLAYNHMKNAHVEHGICGHHLRQNFHCNRYSTINSSIEDWEDAVFSDWDVVPNAGVGRCWEELFPGEQVDLLKIDIEGMEAEWIELEMGFIREFVKRMVVEVHSKVLEREVVGLVENGCGMMLVGRDLRGKFPLLLFKRRN